MGMWRRVFLTRINAVKEPIHNPMQSPQLSISFRYFDSKPLVFNVYLLVCIQILVFNYCFVQSNLEMAMEPSLRN